MKSYLPLLVLTSIISTASIAMPKQEDICRNNGIDYKMARNFYIDLQKDIRKDRVDHIAEHIQYPLRINTMRNKKLEVLTLNNEEEFKNAYPSIFNNQLKKDLLVSQIFCNYQGASFGRGRIWFKTTRKGAMIFAINTAPTKKK